MNGEIYQISFTQFMQMQPGCPTDEVEQAAKLSAEIIVGMYGGQVLCFVGLIPKTLVSDSAYIWMITTDEGKRHGVILARYAKGFITVAMLKYRCLFGHCFENQSVRWLKSLGAEFTCLSEFEIRRR